MNCVQRWTQPNQTVRQWLWRPFVGCAAAGALSLAVSVPVIWGQEQAGNPSGTPATAAANNQTPATTAPEATAPAAAASVEKSLAELLADWAILEKRMIDKEADFNKAEEVLAKEEIKFTYTDMINEANLLIGKIREVAKAELVKENGDPAALKTLMGIMVNDAKNEAIEQVLADGDFLISRNIDPKYFNTAATLERLPIDAKEVFEELAVRQREAAANDLPRVKLTTSQGEIVIELFENEAPNTVANFISLVEAGFYKGLSFHRVLEGFMAQTGCPSGNGTGGPGYNIACECYTPEARRHFPGSISMAKAPARDTGGSQFFLCFTRSEAIRALDGKHTVFGRVVSGMDTLKKILPTHSTVGVQEVAIAGKTLDKILSAEVVRKREHEYKPVKVGESQPTTPPPAQPTEGKSDGGTPPAEKSGAEKAADEKTEGEKTEGEAKEGEAKEGSGGGN